MHKALKILICCCECIRSGRNLSLYHTLPQSIQTWQETKTKRKGAYRIRKRVEVSIAKDLGPHRVGQVFLVPSFLFSSHAITTTKTRDGLNQC